MFGRARFRIRILFLAAVAGLAAGPACVNQLASSSITTDDGISGRSFSDSEFLDPHPENPDLDASTWRTFNGFDLGLHDGDAWLAASFHSEGDGIYLPWVRRYDASRGEWSETAEDFRSLDLDTLTASRGFVRTASSASGGLLAAFLPEDGTETSGLLTVSYDGDWNGPRSTIAAAGDHWLPYVPGTAWAPELPLGLFLFDEDIGLFSWIEDDDDSIHVGLWSRTHLDGIAADTLSTRPAGPGGGSSSHRIIEDGTGRTCLFTEDDDYSADGGATQFRAVQRHCIEDPKTVTAGSFTPDASEAFSPSLDATTDASISALVFDGDDLDADGIQDLPQDTLGFDVASDGSGGMLAVFQQFDLATAKWLLKSREARDGSWDQAILAVDSDPPADYDGTAALASAPLPPASPALVHLEDSKYLAVWAGFDPVSSIELLFASTYDAATDTWSRTDILPFDATMDADYLDAVGEYHPIESIQLFTNHAGQALLAVRIVSGNPRGDSADDTDDLVRKYALARYSAVSGLWTEFFVRGRPGYRNDTDVGCWPSEADDPPTFPTLENPTGVGPQRQACLHPGRGAVFEDGSAIFIFPMQDNDMRYRIAGVRFEQD